MKIHSHNEHRLLLVLLAAASPATRSAEAVHQHLTLHGYWSGEGVPYGDDQDAAKQQKKQQLSRSREVKCHALASVFKLSPTAGAALGRPQQRSCSTTSAFLGGLRHRWIGRITGDSTTNNTNGGQGGGTKPTASSGNVSVLQSIVRALKSSFTLGNAGVRCGSTSFLAILVTAACVLTVAANNTIGSRPAAGVGDATTTTVVYNPTVPLLATTPAAPAGDSTGERRAASSWRRALRIRSTAASRRAKAARSRLLRKAPRFPLAHVSWWTALQDRRQVGGVWLAVVGIARYNMLFFVG